LSSKGEFGLLSGKTELLYMVPYAVKGINSIIQKNAYQVLIKKSYETKILVPHDLQIAVNLIAGLYNDIFLLQFGQE
jgi:hypothetical protein